MSNELPGEWGDRLKLKRIHSYRDMATAVSESAGESVSPGTMHRLVTGKPTSAATVNKVATALFDGDRDLVWRLRGSSRRDYGDWQLPAEASLLTEDQRSAVLAVVQAMVPAEQEGGGEHVSSAATSKPAEDLAVRQVAITRYLNGDKQDPILSEILAEELDRINPVRVSGVLPSIVATAGEPGSGPDVNIGRGVPAPGLREGKREQRGRARRK